MAFDLDDQEYEATRKMFNKDEIQIGEYIRTKLGDIHKITEGFEFIIKRYNSSSNKIVKHSKNIIDLIEVGDYVNGQEIVEIETDPFVKGQINLWTDIQLVDVYGDYERLKYIFNDIKSIVTKEQYKQIEYIVEE